MRDAQLRRRVVAGAGVEGGVNRHRRGCLRLLGENNDAVAEHCTDGGETTVQNRRHLCFASDAGPALAPSPTGNASPEPTGSGSNQPTVRFRAVNRAAATAPTCSSVTDSIRDASDDDLLAVRGIGPSLIKPIRNAVR